VGFFILRPRKTRRPNAKGTGDHDHLHEVAFNAEEIDEVTAIVKHYGYKVHSIEGESAW